MNELVIFIILFRDHFFFFFFNSWINQLAKVYPCKRKIKFRCRGICMVRLWILGSFDFEMVFEWRNKKTMD
jgi:hypothetical protein